MTTIYYPDVSNFQGTMAIEPSTVAVVAKVSESTTYADPTYEHYKSAAAAQGALFSAYHFLHAGNGAAQGRYARSLAGAGVPIMIDCEPTGSSNPTVQDCEDFAEAAGQVWGTYFPQWYWSQLGQPSLAAIPGALVSSDYAAYSDSYPGWNTYGGRAPQVAQYTDALAYSGQSVDFNAYKGTVQQLAQLWGLAAASPAATSPEDPDMPLIVRNSASSSVSLLSGSILHGILDPASLQAYINAGVTQVTVVGPEYAALQADFAPVEAEVAAAVKALGTTGLTISPTGQLTVTGSLNVAAPAS